MKMKEIRKKNQSELRELLQEKRENLIKERASLVQEKGSNAQKVRNLKKDCARILTVINEKEKEKTNA